METLKVISHGKIEIPERVREHLGIKDGTKLVLIEVEEKMILVKEEDFFAEGEEQDWVRIAQKGLVDVWENPKDAAIWEQFL